MSYANETTKLLSGRCHSHDDNNSRNNNNVEEGNVTFRWSEQYGMIPMIASYGDDDDTNNDQATATTSKTIRPGVMNRWKTIPLSHLMTSFMILLLMAVWVQNGNTNNDPTSFNSMTSMMMKQSCIYCGNASRWFDNVTDFTVWKDANWTNVSDWKSWSPVDWTAVNWTAIDWKTVNKTELKNEWKKPKGYWKDFEKKMKTLNADDNDTTPSSTTNSLVASITKSLSVSITSWWHSITHWSDLKTVNWTDVNWTAVDWTDVNFTAVNWTSMRNGTHHTKNGTTKKKHSTISTSTTDSSSPSSSTTNSYFSFMGSSITNWWKSITTWKDIKTINWTDVNWTAMNWTDIDFNKTNWTAMKSTTNKTTTTTTKKTKIITADKMDTDTDTDMDTDTDSKRNTEKVTKRTTEEVVAP